MRCERSASAWRFLLHCVIRSTSTSHELASLYRMAGVYLEACPPKYLPASPAVGSAGRQEGSPSLPGFSALKTLRSP